MSTNLIVNTEMFLTRAWWLNHTLVLVTASIILDLYCGISSLLIQVIEFEKNIHFLPVTLGYIGVTQYQSVEV